MPPRTTRRNTKAVMGKKTGKTQKVKITKTVRVPKMKDTQKAGVLAVVRRILSQNVENKVIGNAVEYNVQHNSGIGPADCVPLLPAIPPLSSAAGSTAMQRIGDKIKPKKLRVSGTVSLQQDQMTQQDLYARILVLTQKDVKVSSQVLGGGIDTAHLLRADIDPTNPEVPFSGYTMDLEYYVNSNKFRVYMDSIVKLTGAKEGSVESLGKYSYNWTYSFSELPASFTFDEGNGDYVNNFAPFVAIGYSYSDGTAPDTVATRLISNVYSRLDFEDA